MTSNWLHRIAVFVAAGALALLASGAILVSRSGPQTPIGPIHAFSGAALAALALLVALMATKTDALVRKTAWAVVLVAALSGVAGAPFAREFASKGAQVAHATLSHLFFGLSVAVAVATSAPKTDSEQKLEDGGWPSLRAMAVATPAILLLQVGLGAAYRYQMIGVVPHVAWAFVAAIAALMEGTFVLTQFPRHRNMYWTSVTLMGLTLLQVILGVAALLGRVLAGEARWMPHATAAHVVTGALVLGASMALGLRILQNVVTVKATVANGNPVMESGRRG